MSSLKKLSHSIISHESLATFARTTMTHVLKHKEDLFVSRQVDVLTILLRELNAAFQRILTNKYTRAINELDLRRDKMIVALRSLLNAIIAQDFMNPQNADAAKQIKVHLDNMDERVTTLGYSEESAQIEAFLSAVKKLDEITIQLSTASGVITALEATQNEFDAMYNQKISEDIQKDEPRPIRVIRKDITLRIEAILSYVNINGIDLPNEYNATVKSLNSLITDVMARAKADQTRKKNAEVKITK